MEESIVPATEADYVAVMGKSPERSFLGFAVRRDGQPVAVAGIYFTHGNPVVFSAGGEKVRPRTVLKTAKEVLKLAQARGFELFALRDPNIPTSASLMRHFNFVPVQQAPAGEIYQWDRTEEGV